MSLENKDWSFQVALEVKNPHASAGDLRDKVSIPGLGRSFGRGHGNPLQYFCLENSMDREARRATVHRVPKSQIWLKRLSTHTCTQKTKITRKIVFFVKYISIKCCRSTPECGSISKTCTRGSGSTFKRIFWGLSKNCQGIAYMIIIPYISAWNTITYFLIYF